VRLSLIRTNNFIFDPLLRFTKVCFGGGTDGYDWNRMVFSS